SDHRVSRLKTYLPSCSTGACSSPNCWTTEAKRSSFSFGSLRIFTGCLLCYRESTHSDYRRRNSEREGVYPANMRQMGAWPNWGGRPRHPRLGGGRGWGFVTQYLRAGVISRVGVSPWSASGCGDGRKFCDAS